MFISELIEELERIKKKHGDIEVVIESTTIFDEKVNSTVETLKVINFHGVDAVRLYWEMF